MAWYARELYKCVNLTPSNSDTFSFHAQIQPVKIDSEIYHLDRLKSSLKSKFFEELFTDNDFQPGNDIVLKVQFENNEVFPIIVDIIHGKKLLNVLTKDNYISLLAAMDQLMMKIDLRIISKFISRKLKSYSVQDAKIFELYNFIRKNSKFDFLLWNIFKFMSCHMAEIQDHDVFLSLPVDHLIRILKFVRKPDDDKKYDIIQMCTRWLCHDMENRLRHMAKLIKLTRYDFLSGKNKNRKSNEKISSRLPVCNVDEQAKQQIIARCLFSLLAYGGKLDPNIRWEQKAYCESCDGNDSDYNRNLDIFTEENEEYEEEGNTSKRFVHNNDEYAKLRKFLKNVDFYDITVRVGEKSYKLHRAVLESKCGYFADLFRTEYAEGVALCGEIPKCPDKDKEYVIDDIDESNFDSVINYIYFYEPFPFSFDIIPSVLKIVDILKIENFSTDWESWLEEECDDASSQDIIEMLNFTFANAKYNDLHSMYLCKHMREKWPEIYDMSKFCSISWPLLEITLKSPYFHFDDPHKILDVCSTWVIHDVKNRYRLLPEIAKIINPNCVPNHEKYAAENAASNDHSQQLIRDELWEILSSIEYLTSSQSIPTNTTENLEDIPAFIAEKRIGPGHLHALNATLDDITPKGIFEDRFKYNHYSWCMSTALIGDNVYFFSSGPSSLLFYEPILFFLHNFKLNKSYKLASDNRIKTPAMKFTLLNCNDEIYCCSETGSLMAKYSMQFNRWMILSQQSQNETSYIPSIRFVSDGKNLYRTHEVYENDSWNYIIGTYDFEKNLWTRVPDLPPIRSSLFSGPLQLIVINDGDLAVTFLEQIVVFDRDSKTWRHHKIPQELLKEKHLFVQHGDRLLFVVDDKLYHVSLSDDKWEFKKNFDLTTIRPIN